MTPSSWEKRAVEGSGEEEREQEGKIREEGKEKTWATKTTILEGKYNLHQCLNLMTITLG